MNTVVETAILALINGHVTVQEKTENYAEEIVPSFTDMQFKRNFRIDPQTFEDFLQKWYSVRNNEARAGQSRILLEKMAMITVWCLSNMESFRSVGDRFGITKSTCWKILYEICYDILHIDRKYKIITWPSNERANEITAAFQQINGFKGVIGCIDGSHIKILPPKDYPNSYCNRKNYHSILLQGVCDHKKLFTHIYTGEPGSIQDNRLFEKSDLYRDIESGNVQFPNDNHLLGDLAYKLRKYLMVGFKNNGALTNQQKIFNYKLSQIRVSIENAFAYLKGRFRRLKYLETIDIEQELAEERLNQEVDEQNQRNNNQLALAKRNRLVNLLYLANN